MGSAHTLFPVDVAMMAKAGVDVGELNHSVKFSTKVAECVGEVVQSRVVAYPSGSNWLETSHQDCG